MMQALKRFGLVLALGLVPTPGLAQSKEQNGAIKEAAGVFSGGTVTAPILASGALGSCVPDSGGHGLLFSYNGVVGCTRLTDAAPDVTRVMPQSAYPAASTNNTGADLRICGGLGRRRIAMTQANCTGGADTITITLETTATVGTATTTFACGSTDAELATNVAAWADGLTGIDACANTACTGFTGTSGTVYIYRATDEATACIVTLATNDATFAAITSGTDGDVVIGAESGGVSLSVYGGTYMQFRDGGSDTTAIRSTATNRLDISPGSSAQLWLTSAGTTVIGNAAWSIDTTGATLSRFPQADLTAGSCTLGQMRLDTGGATAELCYCQATNTWYCWSATTITGPTD